MNEGTIKKQNSNPFKLSQILIPVFIGIAVIVYLFLREFDIKSLAHIKFSTNTVLFIMLAVLLMIGRDVGMIWRFRLLADKEITWRQAFNIHILSEFTSAVTPSAVGGSGLVVLFMNKEGVNIGKSTAIMFVALIMDELFFIVLCPIIFLFVPLDQLFNGSNVFSSTINVFFWTVYAIISVWTLLLAIGLFFRPDIFARIMRLIFRLPFLNRWHSKIVEFGESIVESSKEISKKSKEFWLKISATTVLTWSSRFLVVNALFLAFSPKLTNQLVIFGRQLMLWIVMIVSPTPGGSGLTEFAFKEYYSDIALSPTSILIIIVLWRIISYYFYLFLGTLVIPKWLSGKFIRKKDND